MPLKSEKQKLFKEIDTIQEQVLSLIVRLNRLEKERNDLFARLNDCHRRLATFRKPPSKLPHLNMSNLAINSRLQSKQVADLKKPRVNKSEHEHKDAKVNITQRKEKEVRKVQTFLKSHHPQTVLFQSGNSIRSKSERGQDRPVIFLSF